MKSQTTAEISVFIALIFIMIFIFISFFYDFRPLSERLTKQNSEKIWANAPIGVNAIHLFDNRTEIYLVNNNRIKVNIIDVYLNGESLELNTTLHSGEKTNLTSQKIIKELDLDISIIYNFSSGNIFNLSYEGIMFPAVKYD